MEDLSKDEALAAPSDIVTTESEEMYLITIARAVEDGHHGPVPIPRVAEALHVSQVAANEMVRKLSGRELVDYVPYRGVSLTEAGVEIARGVLRRRRLWGVFLTEHLGLSPQEADTVACEFEHVTPVEVEMRLATFLGDPSVGPQGRPIPASRTLRRDRVVRSLVEVDVGSRVRVGSVDAATPILHFLAAEGIAAGTEMVVVGRGDRGTAVLAVGDHHVEVAGDVAASIMVGDTDSG
jgi:DtxR family Mn-dependent transcriptional regulator